MLPAVLRAFFASLVLATAFGETAPSSALPGSALFDYDRAAPLDRRILDSETHDGAIVQDILFAGTESPIRAYLVRPATAASPQSLAAILYVHWLGNPSTSNRTQFLSEATALADRGFVSLLIDAMWAEPKWYQNRIPEDDYARSLRQIRDLRRSLDLLLAEPGVDARRVAFVGHDFGAMYGIIMGAVDRRPSTYVFMAPAARLIDAYLSARQPSDLDTYRAQLTPLNPLNFVAHLAPAPVFFQFAANDDYVTPEAAAALYAAARPRKHAATYDARHALQDSDASADRITWLLRTLAPK